MMEKQTTAGPIALRNEAIKLSEYGERVDRWRREIKTLEQRSLAERLDEDRVQCADCLAWIDRDGPHTCKQQIRRNQKRGEKQT